MHVSTFADERCLALKMHISRAGTEVANWRRTFLLVMVRIRRGAGAARRTRSTALAVRPLLVLLAWFVRLLLLLELVFKHGAANSAANGT